LVRVLTSVLTPGEFGLYALGWSAVTLTQQTATGPIGQAISRYYRPAVEGGSLPSLYAATVRLVAASVALIVVLTATVAGILSLLAPQFIPLGLMIGCYLAVSSPNTAIDSLFMAARQRKLVAVQQAAAQWLRCGFVIAAVYIWGRNATSAVAGMTVGTIPILALQLFFLRCSRLQSIGQPDVAARDACLRNMMSFGLPFCAWGLFTWAQLASDRWALAFLVDASATGYYNAIYQVGFYPMLLIGGILISVVLPYMYELAGDSTDPARTKLAHSLLLKVCTGFATVTVVAFIAAGSLHSLFCQAVLGSAFRSQSSLIPIAVLSGGIFVTAQILSLIHSIDMTTKRLMPPKILIAGFGVAANAIAAHSFGLRGVLLAGLAASLAYLLAIVCVSQRALLDASGWRVRGTKRWS
jgi:O-antigen/teichoic acid export membrane protein